MTRFLPLALAGALLLGGLLALAGPASAAKPAYFESVVAKDTANDFGSNGALDIVAVHFAEKYRFNKDDRTGEYVLVIRWELRAISDHPCGTTARYEATFTSGGQARNLYAGMTSTPGTGNEGCRLTAADGSGTVKLNDTSISLTIPAKSIGLAPNATVTGICARSAVMAPAPVGQPQYQDLVPFDNSNAPMSACPTTGLPSYTGKGIFPYVTAVAPDGLFRYSVNGAEVEFSLQVASHPAISGDQINVYFDIPDGWSVAPSQGTTGSSPVGSFTGGSGGTPRPFSFTVSNTQGASVGDTAQIGAAIISDTGGLVNLTALVEVSGEKIEDPSITVTLLSPGPFKAGQTSEVRVSFGYGNDTIVGEQVKLDLMQGTKRLSTFVATEKGNGTYSALVQFPGAGTYTLDAYLSSLTPSPHQSFTVQVEKSGGLLPAPGLWSLILLLTGAALLRRRPT